MSKKLVIIGASGHGKVVANIAKLNHYDDIVFLDDDSSKDKCGQYDVIGTSKNIDKYSVKNCDFVIAIGDNKIRSDIYNMLVKKKFSIATLIHPTAVLDETVTIGEGTVVMANAVINTSTKIGEACIINTSSSVDHDCIIKNYVHISPNVSIAGSVSIGEKTWVGIGSILVNNINITQDCIIGAGSVVTKDIKKAGTYVGTPVRRLSR